MLIHEEQHGGDTKGSQEASYVTTGQIQRKDADFLRWFPDKRPLFQCWKGSLRTLQGNVSPFLFLWEMSMSRGTQKEQWEEDC